MTAPGELPFTIDRERLRQICRLAHDAFKEETGIYRDKASLLPQWYLPEDLEYNPKRDETRNADLAGNYLWVLASMERMTLSSQNIRSGLRVWKDKEDNWIFNPRIVANSEDQDVVRVCVDKLRYILQGFPYNLQDNAVKIVQEYGGLARNIIDGCTVEEARKRLMEFKAIGSGIANLYLIYCVDRKIATVLDPENMRIKLDVHKTRVPINTDAVVVLKDRVRRDAITPMLEEEYLKICREEGLKGRDLDAALWIIGSSVCIQKNYKACLDLCPLEKLCISCVREDKIEGTMVVMENGRRIETRTHSNQDELELRGLD